MRAEITCDCAVLADPECAPEQIARVPRSAVEQSLPVYVALPRDQTGAEVEPVPVLPRSKRDAAAVEECAQEILSRWGRVTRPAVMVDVEVRRYGLEEKVAALGRKLGVPVVTSFLGRGLLAQHSELVDVLLTGAPSGNGLPDNAGRGGCSERREGKTLVPSEIAATINDFFARHGAIPIASDTGDCLFTALQIVQTPLVGPGLLCGHGIRSAGRFGDVCSVRPTDDDSGGRWGVSDDGLGAVSTLRID